MIFSKLTSLTFGVVGFFVGLGVFDLALAQSSRFQLSSSGSTIWGVRSAGGSPLLTDEVGFEFGVGVEDSRLLFEELTFNNQDVGKTFTATSAKDPDFDPIVELLTNGINDLVFFNSTFVNGDLIGRETTEAEAFSLESIDFEGTKINSIDLVIKDLKITSPGGDPNGDGNWTQVNYDAEVTVNVAIPEVSSPLGLLALATLSISSALMGKRRYGAKTES